MRLRTAGMALFVLAIAVPSGAVGTWYDYYLDARDKHIPAQQWDAALASLKQAVKLKPDSGVDERTYGMDFVDYFPYYYQGVVYHRTQQWDSAILMFNIEEKAGAIKKRPLYRELMRLRREAEAARAEVDRAIRIKKLKDEVDRLRRESAELPQGRPLRGCALAAGPGPEGGGGARPRHAARHPRAHPAHPRRRVQGGRRGRARAAHREGPRRGPGPAGGGQGHGGQDPLRQRARRRPRQRGRDRRARAGGGDDPGLDHGGEPAGRAAAGQGTVRRRPLRGGPAAAGGRRLRSRQRRGPGAAGKGAPDVRGVAPAEGPRRAHPGRCSAKASASWPRASTPTRGCGFQSVLELDHEPREGRGAAAPRRAPDGRRHLREAVPQPAARPHVPRAAPRRPRVVLRDVVPADRRRRRGHRRPRDGEAAVPASAGRWWPSRKGRPIPPPASCRATSASSASSSCPTASTDVRVVAVDSSGIAAGSGLPRHAAAPVLHDPRLLAGHHRQRGRAGGARIRGAAAAPAARGAQALQPLHRGGAGARPGHVLRPAEAAHADHERAPPQQPDDHGRAAHREDDVPPPPEGRAGAGRGDGVQVLPGVHRPPGRPRSRLLPRRHDRRRGDAEAAGGDAGRAALSRRRRPLRRPRLQPRPAARDRGAEDPHRPQGQARAPHRRGGRPERVLGARSTSACAASS